MFVLPELLGPQISIRKTSAGMQGWPCLYLLLEEPWSKFTNFIFFRFYIFTLEIWHAVKKWQQLAEEKTVLDKQTEEIHQKFKMDKINKEFGQLSGEELFKPITKRLDEKSSDNVEEEEEEQEGPDYTMDEFDRTNPFSDEFRPDAPTPPLSPEPSPPLSPEPSSGLLKEQSQPSLEPLKEQLPPSLGLTPESVKESPPPYHAFDDYPGETDEKIKKRLSFVKGEITKIKNDPNYKKNKNFNIWLRGL